MKITSLTSEEREAIITKWLAENCHVTCTYVMHMRFKGLGLIDFDYTTLTGTMFGMPVKRTGVSNLPEGVVFMIQENAPLTRRP